MNTISSFTESQTVQVHDLYKQVWWANQRTLEQTRRCINGSQLCFGIVDENSNVIAFARVLTDFTFKAIIFDVIVCQNHRAKGLGDKLMNLIQQHPQLKQVQHLELYCLPEMEAYYQQFGFSNNVGGVNLMRAL